MASKCLLVTIWIVSTSFVVSKPVESLFDSSYDTSLKDAIMFDLSCDPCSPGWGVKTLCNGTSNTVCIPCPSGTWSPKRPHFRPCLPCSKCGEGLYEDMPCTNSRDTKCDSCANVKGHFNEDYKRKCDWLRAPDSLKAASDETYDSGPQLEDDDYLNGGLDMNLEDKQWLMDIDGDYFGADDANEVDEPTVSDVDDQLNEDIDVGDQEEGVPVFSKSALRKRIMVLGQSAVDELNELTEKLEKKSDTEGSWSAEDAGEDPAKHVMRPLPRLMPRKDPPLEPVDTVDSWEEDVLESGERRVEVNFPPSYHAYPIESMMHTHRRKTLVLMVVTAVLVITAVAFIVLYVLVHYRRQRSAYNPVTAVQLSSEEREIVRNSASRLQQIERPVKRYQFVKSDYQPLVNAHSDTSLCITENPLQAYLDCESKPASALDKKDQI